MSTWQNVACKIGKVKNDALIGQPCFTNLSSSFPSFDILENYMFTLVKANVIS